MAIQIFPNERLVAGRWSPVAGGCQYLYTYTEHWCHIPSLLSEECSANQSFFWKSHLIFNGEDFKRNISSETSVQTQLGTGRWSDCSFTINNRLKIVKMNDETANQLIEKMPWFKFLVYTTSVISSSTSSSSSISSSSSSFSFCKYAHKSRCFMIRYDIGPQTY